jgi:hypothetical protein
MSSLAADFFNSIGQKGEELVLSSRMRKNRPSCWNQCSANYRFLESKLR